MVELGVLPLLVEMLEGENVEEHVVACRTLWNLAFHKDVAMKIMVIAIDMDTKLYLL